MYIVSQTWGKSRGAHGYLVSLFTSCSNCFASVTTGNQTGIYVWFYSICIDSSEENELWRQTGFAWILVLQCRFGICYLNLRASFSNLKTGNNWPTHGVVVRIRWASACKALSAAPATEQTLSECYCDCNIGSNKPCPPLQCSSWVLPSNLLYVLQMLNNSICLGHRPALGVEFENMKWGFLNR